jgi:hypothetical protein
MSAKRVNFQSAIDGRAIDFADLSEPQCLSIERAYKRKKGTSARVWREMWEEIWEEIETERYHFFMMDFAKDQPKTPLVKQRLKALIAKARALRRTEGLFPPESTPAQNRRHRTLEAIYEQHFENITCPTFPDFLKFYLRILSGLIALSELAEKN